MAINVESNCPFSEDLFRSVGQTAYIYTLSDNCKSWIFKGYMSHLEQQNKEETIYIYFKIGLSLLNVYFWWDWTSGAQNRLVLPRSSVLCTQPKSRSGQPNSWFVWYLVTSLRKYIFNVGFHFSASPQHMRKLHELGLTHHQRIYLQLLNKHLSSAVFNLNFFIELLCR